MCLKIHVLVTSSGDPVEVFFTPGSRNDTRALKQFDFDLPDGSTIHGDKAYNDYDFEDLLAEAAEINLSPLRKKNSKRKESLLRYASFSTFDASVWRQLDRTSKKSCQHLFTQSPAKALS
jgi:hypothetical protein